MEIKINGKIRQLKFSFNSFKYLEDFDFAELEDMETKPFKLIRVTEELLFSAVNNDRKNYISVDLVQDYLEEVLEKGELPDLFAELAEMLQSSSFFQNLQENPEESETEEIAE